MAVRSYVKRFRIINIFFTRLQSYTIADRTYNAGHAFKNKRKFRRDRVRRLRWLSASPYMAKNIGAQAGFSRATRPCVIASAAQFFLSWGRSGDTNPDVSSPISKMQYNVTQSCLSLWFVSMATPCCLSIYLSLLLCCSLSLHISMAIPCCLSIYLSLWQFHVVSLSTYLYGYSMLSLYLPIPVAILCCSSIYLSLRLYHVVSLYITMAILCCCLTI